MNVIIGDSVDVTSLALALEDCGYEIVLTEGVARIEQSPPPLNVTVAEIPDRRETHYPDFPAVFERRKNEKTSVA